MLLSDLDLHLFGEGTHRRLWEVLGAVSLDDGRTRFAVWAPNAAGVDVIGDWNDWSPQPLSAQSDSGVWAVVADAQPGHRYKFMVHGADGRTTLKADPMAMAAERPPSDASVVSGPTAHVWSDDAWMAKRSRALGVPLRIYEVHLGSWRRGVDSYTALAEQLADHVASLGFTHITSSGINL